MGRGRVETSLESHQCASPPERSLPYRIFGQSGRGWRRNGANSVHGPLGTVFSPIFWAQMGAYAPTRRMAFIVFENPRIRRTRFKLYART